MSESIVGAMNPYKSTNDNVMFFEGDMLLGLLELVLLYG